MYNTSERKRERHCTADYYTLNGFVWYTEPPPGYLRQNDPNRAASCVCRSLSCMRCRRSVSMHEPASVMAMTSCVAGRANDLDAGVFRQHMAPLGSPSLCRRYLKDDKVVAGNAGRHRAGAIDHLAHVAVVAARAEVAHGVARFGAGVQIGRKIWPAALPGQGSPTQPFSRPSRLANARIAVRHRCLGGALPVVPGWARPCTPHTRRSQCRRPASTPHWRPGRTGPTGRPPAARWPGLPPAWRHKATKAHCAAPYSMLCGGAARDAPTPAN